MTNEVTATENKDFLAMLERLASSPDVDPAKFNAMLDVQERIINKQAESAFNAAMARLQPQLPVIKKDSQIKHNEKLISSYAKYEDIDKIIRPLYLAEGFSISFNSKKAQDGGVTYYGTLSHVEGHSRTAEIDLPADTSGAKNAVQAKGSSMTYAQRYLIGMLFNLVFSNADDDGKFGGAQFIDAPAVKMIENLLTETKADRLAFLQYMGVAEVENIVTKDLPAAINGLMTKKGKMKP